MLQVEHVCCVWRSLLRVVLSAEHNRLSGKRQVQRIRWGEECFLWGVDLLQFVFMLACSLVLCKGGGLSLGLSFSKKPVFLGKLRTTRMSKLKRFRNGYWEEIVSVLLVQESGTKGSPFPESRKQCGVCRKMQLPALCSFYSVTTRCPLPWLISWIYFLTLEQLLDVSWLNKSLVKSFKLGIWGLGQVWCMWCNSVIVINDV